MNHHQKHHHEFGGITPAEYARRASEFLGCPLDPLDTDLEVLECSRINGDRVRYNTRTGEFGVLSHAGVIRTYMVPDATKHPYPSNLVYFWANC